MKFASILLVALTFSCPVMASDWTIKKDGSSIAFEGTQMGASFEGNFKKFDGTITFDEKSLPTSKADIIIHTASIDANSTDRNQYVIMPDWLDTTKFPDAHFVTTSIEKGADDTHYIAQGNLTLRDMTMPLSLPFTLSVKDNQAIMDGQTSINRLDYGVGQGQWKDTETVGNAVKIKIHLIADQK